MKYCLRIEVRLKSGHSDPEGETTAHLLKELGYRVGAVNVSKVYRINITAENSTQARSKAEEICKKLLANPTKDDYAIIIEEER